LKRSVFIKLYFANYVWLSSLDLGLLLRDFVPRRIGTVSALSARPHRSAVTSFTHLCPRRRSLSQVWLSSLDLGLLLRDFVPRRSSIVSPKNAKSQWFVVFLTATLRLALCSCGNQRFPRRLSPITKKVKIQHFDLLFHILLRSLVSLSAVALSSTTLALFPHQLSL